MKRLRRILISFTLVAILSAVYLWSTKSFASGGGTGVVSGVVETGGAPVSGAIVSITVDDQVMATAVSRSNGAYSFLDVPEGTHQVDVQATGYAREQSSVIVLAGQTRAVHFSLVVEATVAGKVTQSDGTTPVAGVVAKAQAVGEIGASGLTDQAGNYVIGGLSAGSYTITGLSTDFAVTQQNISVSTGQDLTGVDLVAENGGIAGTVTKNDGTTPIEGAAVMVLLGTDVLSVIFTDAGGNYIAGPLASGSYKVQATLEGAPIGEISAVSVVADQITQGQDIGAPGGSISGTVLTTDTPPQPISGAQLEALGDTGIFTATTDANGQYTIESLAQGEYRATASIVGLASQWITAVNVVTNQDTGGQDFSLSGGGGISGKVVDAGSGLAIEGIGVSILRSEQAAGCCESVTLGTLTDANGDYLIAGVSPEAYYVVVMGDGYRSDSLVGVVVNAGQTTAGQDFSLGTTGGTISGNVYEADGTTPISGATVSCFGLGLSLAGATTDTSGAYRLELLEAGDYTVTALADGFDTAANEVTVVGTGETSGNNLELPAE